LAAVVIVQMFPSSNERVWLAQLLDPSKRSPSSAIKRRKLAPPPCKRMPEPHERSRIPYGQKIETAARTGGYPQVA
jgi:hypothetical protein